MNVRLLTHVARRASYNASRNPNLRWASMIACRTRRERAWTAGNAESVQKTAFALFLTSASATTTTAYADSQSPNVASSVLEEEPLSVLSRTEPQTGVEFPLLLSATESLHGTGVRLMGGLVRVYAVGFYVDPQAARAALADWVGFSQADILSSDALWDTVCDANASFRRTFRMVVVREVGGKHMKDGFDRGIRPRVAAAAKKGRCKPAECKKAVHQFSNLFMSVGTMKVGSEIKIAVDNGNVSLTVDDRWLGEVKNPQLAWAMVDLFLGGRPVTPTLRQSSAEALEALLRE